MAMYKNNQYEKVLDSIVRYNDGRCLTFAQTQTIFRRGTPIMAMSKMLRLKTITATKSRLACCPFNQNSFHTVENYFHTVVRCTK